MATPARAWETAIALNRFGLGARGDEAAPGDPKAWLAEQLAKFEARPPAFDAARLTTDIFQEYSEAQAGIRDADPSARMEMRKALRQRGNALYRDEVTMRVVAALTSQAPFVERMVHFWSNHFAVSADKPQVTLLAGAFEREAIRPHVLGRFEDMLVAVEQHPAMQFYLDQIRSIGPNSRRAAMAEKNGRKPGVNENLAREILELHTLGVRTGYTQQDVTQFALALSGWTVDGLGEGRDAGNPGSFRFRPRLHEPGPRTIMGRTYPQQGEGQARAVLRDLAKSDATATHVATKLARHFIADDPPDDAVERLKRAYLESDGDLKLLYRTLFDLPEVWTPEAAKFKTPWEWTISALRALGRRDAGKPQPAGILTQLGQPVWRPRQPSGYDDVAASWAAPDALVRRVEVAQSLARTAAGGTDARKLGPELLPGTLSEATRAEVSRAESPATALALLLVSPDFLRR